MDALAANCDLALSHKQVKVNGVYLHCVIGGQGPAIILLHGWPQTWFAWRHLIPLLTPHFTIVAPDLPGLGESERPEAGYDNYSVASDIYELTRQLELSPLCVAGHDIGAAVAYSYAANYPNALQYLVVLDGTIPGLTPDQAFHFTPNQPTWQFNFHAIPELPERLVEGRELAYLSWFFTHKAHRPGAISAADCAEFVQQYCKPGAMKSGFEYYRSFFKSAEQNREHRKVKLSIPVLALGGEYSSSALMLETMRLGADDVRGGIVPDCGHYIAEECPGYLSEQLLLFLKSPRS